MGDLGTAEDLYFDKLLEQAEAENELRKRGVKVTRRSLDNFITDRALVKAVEQLEHDGDPKQFSTTMRMAARLALRKHMSIFNINKAAPHHTWRERLHRWLLPRSWAVKQMVKASNRTRTELLVEAYHMLVDQDYRDWTEYHGTFVAEVLRTEIVARKLED